jgi:hypothetical protein
MRVSPSQLAVKDLRRFLHTSADAAKGHTNATAEEVMVS